MFGKIIVVILAIIFFALCAVLALGILYLILLKVFDLDVMHWAEIEHPTVPFKTFESLYAINPDLWRLNNDSVIYLNYHGRAYCADYEDLDFSALDLHRYHKFRKQLEKQAELKKNQLVELQKAETLERLTKAWTADIEAFVKDNERKMKFAKVENEEIIERILGKRA